ncbi:MAG: 16S rRNA (cytidine(1402)-2'-O)-methyltransferase [Candidatus Dojkabacteria bacterium]|nr:16S rRNA (cytidine(1402)-2'-O)-methyltransferase [Candidatus Dojkabacteria bacterium]
MKLTILGTPIGNLEDVTIRGLRTIFESKIILAEDTRSYSRLKGLIKQRFLETLKTLEIAYDTDQMVTSYRDQNHDRVIERILDILRSGEEVTLVSDAGMPGISDPGFKLIRSVIEAGFEVDVIPSTTAIAPALILSGLPTDRFTFLGFLPKQKGKAIKLIEKDIEERTVVFYESPFRIKKVIDNIFESYPEIDVALVGEITKKFQSTYRGKIADVKAAIKDKKFKGEWVICLRKL